MSIKTKLRQALGPLLEKSTSSKVKDVIDDKSAIKNIVLADIPSISLNVPQYSGGFLRILARDATNAKDIVRTLTEAKDRLDIESVQLVDQAIDYFTVKDGNKPRFTHSVILRHNPKKSLSEAIQMMHSDGTSNLRSQLLEQNQSIPKRLVIDFSSPNIAKPFHYGHLKSTLLGNFLANLNTFWGSQVTRLNYVGDWGTQYGILSLGLDKSTQYSEENLTIRQLLDIYIASNDRSFNDEEYFYEAKEVFRKMDEDRDVKHIERWKKIRQMSLQELEDSYSKLGISFDYYEYESDYAEKAKQMVNDMIGRNFITQLEDGALVANVEKNHRPEHVPVLKSDGSSLYLSRDIAAAVTRKERFNFDKMLYVVGAEQEKHFHFLREILKNLNYDWAYQLDHVMFGKVRGMSTRAGKFVLLSEIIEEVTKRYIEATKNTVTSKVHGDENVAKVGHHLALSSLFIYDMRYNRMKAYNFEWSAILRPSAGSGIDLQTAHARLSSLLLKAAKAGLKPALPSNLRMDSVCCIEASNLICRLNEFDTALQQSYCSNDTNPLVTHAVALANVVNRARQSERMRVLGEKNQLDSETRLALFESAQKQLALSLRLFGLTPLDRV